MRNLYVVLPDGQRHGPASVDDLRSWLQTGNINAQTPIQTPNGTVVPAGSLLFPDAQQAPAPPIPPPSGYGVPGGANPVAASSYESTSQPSPIFNLREIAKWQRQLCTMFGLQIILYIVMTALKGNALAGLFGLGLLVLVVFVLIAVYKLAEALNLSTPVIYVIGGLLPCVSLIVFLYLITSANKALQAAGIKVGLLGADPNSIQ